MWIPFLLGGIKYSCSLGYFAICWIYEAIQLFLHWVTDIQRTDETIGYRNLNLGMLLDSWDRECMVTQREGFLEIPHKSERTGLTRILYIETIITFTKKNNFFTSTGPHNQNSTKLPSNYPLCVPYPIKKKSSKSVAVILSYSYICRAHT